MLARIQTCSDVTFNFYPIGLFAAHENCSCFTGAVSLEQNIATEPEIKRNSGAFLGHFTENALRLRGSGVSPPI